MGNTKTLLTDSYFKVLTNDSVYLTFNNVLAVADKATFERINTFSGYSAFAMTFSQFGGSPYSWIVDFTVGDSLVLVDNFPNGDGYIMTRIP